MSFLGDLTRCFFFSRDDSICSCKRDSQTKSGFFEGEMYVYTWLFRIYEYRYYILYAGTIYIVHIYTYHSIFIQEVRLISTFSREDGATRCLSAKGVLATCEASAGWRGSVASAAGESCWAPFRYPKSPPRLRSKLELPQDSHLSTSYLAHRFTQILLRV